MSSHEVVDPQHHATGAVLVDTEAPQECCIADAASCECGLPESCCDRYCGIDDCDWMIY